MTLVSIPSPSLIQGVSQQPPLMRFPSQGEIQENCYPSVLDGLQKRHPFQHIAAALSGGIGQPLVHFINRDPSERYVVLAYGVPTTASTFGVSSNSLVAVWDLTTGESVPVYSPSGWGNAADFSYLALPSPLGGIAVGNSPDFSSLTGWTVANNIAATAVTMIPPLGTRYTGSNITTKVYKLGNSGATGATYQGPTDANGLDARGLTASIYARRNDVGGETPLTSFTLSVLDTTSSTNHSAVFTVGTSGAYTCTAGSQAGSAVASVETLPNGWFRCIVAYKPSATDAGHGAAMKITLPNATAGDSLLVWGARMDYGIEAIDWTPPSATALKALTVADYTFLLNTTAVPLMTSAITTEDPNQTTGFIFVNAGNYKTNYNVVLQRASGTETGVSVATWDGNTTSASLTDSWTITMTGTPVGGTGTLRFFGVTAAPLTVTFAQTAASLTANGIAMRAAITAHSAANALISVAGGSGNTTTLTARFPSIPLFNPSTAVNKTFAGTLTSADVHVSNATDADIVSIKTDDIAAEIAGKINALGDGWSATTMGSVVKVVQASSDIIKLQCHDSRGDTNITAVWGSVPSFDVLPLTCEHGYIVKVAGDPVAVEDDYWVSFEATDGSGFGAGNWVECARPSNTGASDYTTTTLDATTMPYQLVRREDVTNGRYFEWGPVDWTDRTVGSDTENPLPSFVSSNASTDPKYLDDIFFWRNRLGFLHGQNVLMSEAALYFNFFRTTVRTVLDSDPIDLSIPHTSVVHLRHAVPFDDELYLFGEQVQFKLTSDPILSPANVQTAPVLEYETLATARPALASRGIFFASPRGDYSSVTQVVGSPNTSRVDTLDIGAPVPKYIPGDILWIAGSDPESCLVMSADGEPSSLFLYKYHDSGQDRLQSAWHKYPLGTGSACLGGFFIASTFYTLMQRYYGVSVEKAVITPGSADTGLSYPIYLDRRIYAGPSTTVLGSYSNPTTTWTLPFTLSPADTVQVVRADTGALVTTANPTTTTVTATGDYSAVNVYIGVKYTALYRFTHPVLRESAGAGKSPVVGGRLQVLRGRLSYSKSQYFNVTVTPLLRTALDATFDNSTDDTGIYSFGIDCLARDVIVELTNDSHRPSNITNVEWECNYTSLTTRAPS